MDNIKFDLFSQLTQQLSDIIKRNVSQPVQKNIVLNIRDLANHDTNFWNIINQISSHIIADTKADDTTKHDPEKQ
jgi:hypothetical protein